MLAPLDWANDEVRREFFGGLPRPLAVMLACDMAALVPQPVVGAEAIACARRWIMGQAEPHEVRQAARAAAAAASSTADPAYAAAAAAHTVHTQAWYLAQSASWVCEAVRSGALQRGVDLHRADWEVQSRRVEFLRQAMEESHVRRLLAGPVDDPHLRLIFWDALLDAGYTPQPVVSWRAAPPQ